jgi:hypothetical protein
VYAGGGGATLGLVAGGRSTASAALPAAEGDGTEGAGEPHDVPANELGFRARPPTKAIQKSRSGDGGPGPHISVHPSNTTGSVGKGELTELDTGRESGAATHALGP